MYQNQIFINILIFFMNYAVVVPHIPKDVYDLIQIFFKLFYLSKIDYWDAFWRTDSSEMMKKFYELLLQRLTEILTIVDKPDDIKRTIVILIKLGLMTFYNYQQALRINQIPPISNAILNQERSAQSAILKILVKIFMNDFALFDLKDEHFAILLDRFFYVDIVKDGNNEEIRRIIK